MWDRKELKSKAKQAFNANYWKSVFAAAITSIIVGGTAASSSTGNDDQEIDAALAGLSPEQILAVLGIVLGIVIIGMLIAFAVKVFIENPIAVGNNRFFIRNSSEPAEMKKDYFSVFKDGYGHISWVMFCRDFFTVLWTCLLVVPGIIKSYEYRMIPYILAENPDIDRKEAFELSKKMMDGNKWNAFVLDVSFLGWILVAGVTIGIAGFLYVFPYIYQTDAELYLALKNEN